MADWMKNVVETTLGPAKASLKVPTQHRTPTGGYTTTYVDGPFSYCNIGAASASEIEIAQRLGYQGNIVCRVSLDFDVDPGNRIVVSDSGADELDGEWEVSGISVGFPAVDRLLYLYRFPESPV